MQSFQKPFSSEEEKRYLMLCQNGDQNAKNSLVEHNLRLVAHIVKKYYTADRELDDLISIGTIGLIKAIHTFDSKKGGRLATYAARCIENELLMMLRQEKKLQKEVSLYDPIGTDQEGNCVSLIDVLALHDCSLEEQYLHKYYLSNLNQVLCVLGEGRERDVIVKRYGLFGERPWTQKEVAKFLGISRSYVSRIEKRALNKLKIQYEQL